jgi:preprotein translocase subunit YajC
VDLQAGEWVRTESGEVGKIVYISRLTVFVELNVPGTNDRIEAFLESQLTRTNPPEE